jgi:DEAD/DEAH box helicase domain-containing protein
MRVCVFDIETRKLATELDPHGWDKLKRGEGGISALAIYDSDEQWTYLYDDSEIDAIATHLESADVVVGWNSKEFDVPIVEGLAKRRLALKHHVDLLVCAKTSIAERGLPHRRGDYTLGSVSERTLGRKKLEKGEHAPVLANEGKWARLFRYCMDDVRLTRDLYNHILSEGGIISAQGTFLPVKLAPPPSDSPGVDE